MIQPLGHPSPTPLTTLTLSPLSHPLTLFQPHLFLCYSLNTPNTLLFQSLRPSITALPRISTPSIQNFVSICLIFFLLIFYHYEVCSIFYLFVLFVALLWSKGKMMAQTRVGVVEIVRNIQDKFWSSYL